MWTQSCSTSLQSETQHKNHLNKISYVITGLIITMFHIFYADTLSKCLQAIQEQGIDARADTEVVQFM